MLEGELQLYDLEADLTEEHDLAALHPELAARARQAMDSMRVPSKEFLAPAER